MAIAASAALLALAMRLYPGGTELDHHAVGHSFWLNFLCDLTRVRALNGAANAGSGFARAAMATLAVGLGAFFMILPGEFPGHRPSATLVRGAGTLSVLGFLALPLGTGPWHAVAVLTAAGPGVLAATAGLVATARHVRHKPLLGAAFGSIIAATVDAALYVGRVRDDYHTCTPLLPVFQRLTLLLAAAWVVTTALRALGPRQPRPIGAPGHLMSQS